MARRKFASGRIMLAFFITLIVFSTGILLGVTLSRGKITFLSEDLLRAQESVDGLETQLLISDNLPPEQACNYLSIQSEIVGAQTDELAEKLTLAESSGKYGPSFTAVKETYTNLLVKYWLISSRLRSKCDAIPPIILYFYNNQDCETCLEQGAAISYAKKKSGGNILVFPLDTGLDMPLVNLLKEAYSVSTQPTTVINDRVFSGYTSADTILAQIEGDDTSA